MKASMGFFPKILKKGTKDSSQSCPPSVPSYLDQPSSAIFYKFQKLEDEQRMRFRDPNYSINEGVSPHNQSRNRYRNVVPWDQTRVRLPVADGYNDYINASWVVLNTGPPDSADPLKSKTYIVTQGPTEHTISHFWQMVNDNCGDTAVVVMLTALDEPYKKGLMSKCARYWPSDRLCPLYVSKMGGFEYDLEVKLRSVTKYSYYEYRELEIYNPGEGTFKTAHHFYYNSWPDWDNPKDGADMVHFVRTVNEKNSDASSPLVVHCSAGIGRSGTYVGIDAALTRDAWVDDDRDLVYDLVNSMRKQRVGMVQKDTQYKYIYDQIKKAVKSELSKSSSVSPVSSEMLRSMFSPTQFDMKKNSTAP
jgi:protein-tyrosine phosphatase